FRVTAPATIRDLIDALVAADRSLSLELHQVEYASGSIDVELSAATDWPLVRRISLPIETLALPPTPLTGPARATVPPALERHIDQFTADPGRDTDTSFATLAHRAAVPMGIEMLPERPLTSDARLLRGAPPPPILVGPGTLSEALSLL